MRGRARPAADRERALSIFRTDGLAAAARQTGIDKGLISRWARAEGVATDATPYQHADHLHASAATHVASMTERRTRLADTLLAIAEESAAEARTIRAFRDRQTLLTCAAIAVDKSQLLAGEATARTETVTPEQARSELTAWESQWRQRHAS